MTDATLLLDGQLAQYHTGSFVDLPHPAAAARDAWLERGGQWVGAWTSTAWPNAQFGAVALPNRRVAVLSAIGDDVVCDILTWFADDTLLYTTSLEYALDLKPFGVVHQRVGDPDVETLAAAHADRYDRLETLCGDAVEVEPTREALLARLDPLYARILAKAQADAKKKTSPTTTQ